MYLWVPMLVVAVATVGAPLSHIAFGTVFALLLVAALTSGNVVYSIFSWRPLVSLGIMSYSLYLVHQPIVQALGHLFRADLGISPTRTFGLLVLLFPLILAIAWALFVLVEQYTLTSRPVEISGLAARILFPTWGRPMGSPSRNPRDVAESKAGIGARSG
jgi:peptidoglycan/LPS O-acetylase OafA/YrhL